MAEIKRPSAELIALMKTKDWDTAMDEHGTCTTGYDNDGSTGYEIYENGFELGTQAQAQGRDAYVFEDHPEADKNAVFILAKDEDELCERINALPNLDDESGSARFMRELRQINEVEDKGNDSSPDE